MTEIQKFRAAARKIARMIEALAAGSNEGLAVSNAINRLYDRERRVEDSERDEVLATIKDLRVRKLAADDLGYAARQASRQKEINALTAQINNARIYGYEKELRIMRGGKISR